jgi:hypothetical protein
VAAIEGVNVADTVVVVVDVTPTGLVLVSGGGQTGNAGSQLAQAVVVRLVSGSTPVAGVTVSFAAGSGGSVSGASAVTDASGQAQTRWTLGPSAGSQTLTVSSAGVPNLSVSATAVVAVRNVSFVSLTPSALSPGGSSSVVVQVRDGSGNVVVGEPVTFSSSSGGVFSPTTGATNASGQASASFSAANAGTYTLTATVTGASAQTSIIVAANNSTTASQLVKISGDGQTVRIGQAFGAPIVVEARNGAGAPVAGAFVDFGTSAGTARAVTGSDGRASILYTVSPQASPGTGTIQVTLFPNSAVAVVFTYTAIP